MADPLLPPSPDDADDEWASAIIDGVAPDDVLRRAETDPALAERVARLRRVREELARPAPIDTDASRAAVAAVLAAFDAERVAATPAGHDVGDSPEPSPARAGAPGNLVSMGDTDDTGRFAGMGRPAGGRPRSRWRRPVGPLAGAAAAVALLVAGGAAVLVSRDREQLATTGDAAMFESSAATTAAAGGAAGASERAAGADASSEATSSGAAVRPPLDLGAHADDASLRRAAVAALSPAPGPTPPTTMASPSASGPEPAVAPPAAEERGCSAVALPPGPRAVASVAGRRVVLTVTGTDVVVLDLAQCTVRTVRG